MAEREGFELMVRLEEPEQQRDVEQANLIIVRSIAGELSNNIIQKALAFRRD